MDDEGEDSRLSSDFSLYLDFMYSTQVLYMKFTTCLIIHFTSYYN